MIVSLCWHGCFWKVLKQQNVSYIVAPYEADAQMTFLAVSKQVEAVITEDSDLIPFGCSRVSFLEIDCFKLLMFYSNSKFCVLVILIVAFWWAALTILLWSRSSLKWTSLGKVLSFSVPCYRRTRTWVLEDSPSRCFLRCASWVVVTICSHCQEWVWKELMHLLASSKVMTR